MSSRNEINIKNYRKVRKIGKGASGTVYEVHTRGNQSYAAKILDCGDDEEQCNKVIGREVEIMMCINHHTIIKFIGYSKIDFNNEKNVTVIMELAKNGSLYETLQSIRSNNRPRYYTNTTRQIILVGISYGMKYLHNLNIIHRDLKPGNILLDENYNPKIADFGFAKIFKDGYSYVQSQFGGTIPYMAPEIFEFSDYGTKVDVYAFGILMYEVITDHVSYPELMQGKLNEFKFKNKVVNENYRPVFTFRIKRSLQQLIEKCWSHNPKDRPTFDEIFTKLSDFKKKDYFLNDVDMDEFYSYYQDITKVNPADKLLLNKIKSIEKRSQQLINENQLLKQKQRSTTNQKNSKTIQIHQPTKEKEQKVINLGNRISNVNFDSPRQLNQIIIPSSVTIIKSHAFSNLSSLEEIIIPSSVVQIENEAFANCIYLKKISISASVTDIGIAAFRNCISLTQITIPSSVTRIENCTFCKCESLKQISLPSSLCVIFMSVFEDCKSLTQINIPPLIKFIGTCVFKNCESLKQITIPPSVTVIDKCSFQYCKSLTQITIPSSVTKIENNAFHGCTSLTRMVIPSSVFLIGDNAFKDCESLEEITIPSSVRCIGSCAFSGCSRLKNVLVPSKTNFMEDSFDAGVVQVENSRACNIY